MDTPFVGRHYILPPSVRHSFSTSKRKKIQYVSLESGAFISDLIFQTMTAAERGVYCTLIFYLYENNGRLGFDIESLKHLCNCADFEKSWEFIKQKFTVKNGKISHKRVTKELNRAKQLSQVQTERAIKAATKRWKNDAPSISPSNASSIAKESEAKGCEGKLRENIDNVSAIAKDLLPSAQNNSRSSIASQIQSLKSSTRLAPLEAGQQRRLTAGITGPAPDLTNTMFFYDKLANTFGGRTPADSTALRNLIRWLGDSVTAGVFTKGIYQRILDMAADSKNGNSRKPIAVFFAQVKKDLGYKKDEQHSRLLTLGQAAGRMPGHEKGKHENVI